MAKLPTALVRVEHRIPLGPAMAALTDKQRAFVVAMIDGGLEYATEGARAAGYADNGGAMIDMTARWLMHHPKVQAALEEYAKGRMKGKLGWYLKQLDGIAGNAQHKDQLRAVVAGLNRAGLHQVTENKHVHEIQTPAEKEAEIRRLAEILGLEATKLIGDNVIDVEAEEVVTLEDVL